jgi:hypothetical protein
MEDDQEDLQQLAALQASAAHKATDFEARKKAKLASDGNKAGDAGAWLVACFCVEGAAAAAAAAAGVAECEQGKVHRSTADSVSSSAF